ncbi:MAG: 3-oxoacyl-[acyl-carrier-protein] reductase [Syntrophobacteraceae bacterium]|nr:3-oxoacyl-[acyl-carrier-protein] reductase [Syntrophobacteraceae bacterium]
MSEQRVVVVTGASRGIGRAIAVGLSAADTHVIVNYNSSPEAADETASLVRSRGGASTAMKFDVADPDAVKAAFDQIVGAHGRIDVLVNNAGIARDNLLALMKPSEWDVVMATNLKGAFLCSQAVIRPMMKRRFGRIVNVTSVVGVTGNPGQCNYSAAKAGIIGLTKSLAREIVSRKITVNAVAPGYIETDMTAALPAKAREVLLAQIPAGRPGAPEEVASAVAFLASDSAGYITGQVIHVNGGMYMA